ncbi:hypothetical protein F4818DRAFT_416343 [Hypoxylon cercidicola]|nr:hypothetical protein F4818DRAFT_416343 [Hypoxylon cercidicola]
MLRKALIQYERPRKKAPILPYNLRDPNVDISTAEICAKLGKIFPGTRTILEPNPRYQLIFQVKELPKGKWPVSIGGMPYTILDKNFGGRAFVLPRRQFGNLDISICEVGYDADNLSEVDLYNLTVEVIDYLCRALCPAACPTELMFTSEKAFYVALNDDFIISTCITFLPGKIAGCCVAYLHDREIQRETPWHMLEPRISEARPKIMSLLPEGVRLSSSTDRIRWSTCYLNGLKYKNLEGNVVMKSLRREPTRDEPDRYSLVRYNWTFMGQHQGNDARERLDNGMYPVWDDEDAVLGFHDHYIAEGDWAGFAVSVSTGHVFESDPMADTDSSSDIIDRDLEPTGFPSAVGKGKDVLRLPGDE